MKPLQTFPLRIAPLPSSDSDATSESRHSPPDDFVDENVIASLIEGPLSLSPSFPRVASAPSDLVLSSDENDFAGWAVRPASPFRVIAERQERETAPPATVETEPGIGQPHRGSHRWWIAAVAGISSALLVSVLFNSLGGSTDSGFAFLSRSYGAIQSAVGSLAP